MTDDGINIDDPLFKEVMTKRNRAQVAATMEQYEKVILLLNYNSPFKMEVLCAQKHESDICFACEFALLSVNVSVNALVRKVL